ncbi:MAG: DUF1840 domain-containing protein [Sphingobacteriia bacterium]|nr:DUF1840 domain-containing protein [Sphingobacteriia bacterium]NCC38469.1 DUF1840 domain-containing protein [Gammaproteobacteria bacterium]
MLVTFKTKAHASITMFGDVAKTLIKLMGHSGAIPGALMAEDIPAALERLQAAVAEQPDAPLEPATGRTQTRAAGEERAVSLAHRARPLIELLSAAAADGEYVMWDQ